MKWEDLIKIPQFTPMFVVLEEFQVTPHYVADLPIVYMGNGCFMAYSNTKYRIEGDDRVEYGEIGEYAHTLYFYQNQAEVEGVFRRTLDFDMGRVDATFEVAPGIYMGQKLKEVTQSLKRAALRYLEGENRTLRNGEFYFLYRYIECNGITYMFFDRSKETKLTAVQYRLKGDE